MPCTTPIDPHAHLVTSGIGLSQTAASSILPPTRPSVRPQKVASTRRLPASQADRRQDPPAPQSGSSSSHMPALSSKSVSRVFAHGQQLKDSCQWRTAQAQHPHTASSRSSRPRARQLPLQGQGHGSGVSHCNFLQLTCQGETSSATSYRPVVWSPEPHVSFHGPN